MALAVQWLQREGKVTTNPIKSAVAAVSVGMKGSEVLLDVDYNEDSSCDVDMNFVLLENARIVELQGTAEGTTFSAEDSQKMLAKATLAIQKITRLQRAILEKCASA
jgi:ribonuclease PH